MVKGISRQVIVVHSPEPDLFEQAIFILKDGREGISDDALLNEAKRLINASQGRKQRRNRFYGPIWACGGAVVVALAWLIVGLM